MDVGLTIIALALVLVVVCAIAKASDKKTIHAKDAAADANPYRRPLSMAGRNEVRTQAIEDVCGWLSGVGSVGIIDRSTAYRLVDGIRSHFQNHR